MIERCCSLSTSACPRGCIFTTVEDASSLPSCGHCIGGNGLPTSWCLSFSGGDLPALVLVALKGRNENPHWKVLDIPPMVQIKRFSWSWEEKKPRRMAGVYHTHRRFRVSGSCKIIIYDPAAADHRRIRPTTLHIHHTWQRAGAVKLWQRHIESYSINGAGSVRGGHPTPWISHCWPHPDRSSELLFCSLHRCPGHRECLHSFVSKNAPDELPSLCHQQIRR